jgi:quinol monooxygenase YgiN
MLHCRRFLLGGVLSLLAGFAMTPAYAQPTTPSQPPSPPQPPAASQPAPAPSVVAPSQPAPAAPAGAPSQPAASAGGAVYIVTYFEVGAASANQTGAMLRAYAAVTRRENGNLGFEALREVGPAGRFAMVEGWRDQTAADAHAAAAKSLSDRLQTSLASPFDTRPCNPLDIGPPSPPLGANAGYVLTHVDVIPAHKDETVELLRQLAAASRQERGVLRFDVIQQPNRLNHLFLVEGWADVNAHNAHVMAPATRDFRSKLLPFEGALYDERIYTLVR